jgi:hypothetical protein
VLSTDNYDFIVDKEEPDAATGQTYAKVLTLKYNGDDMKLRCSLDTKRVVEQTPLPKVNEYNMFNWRFLADYQGEITIDGKTDKIRGETIHERFLFRG